MFGLGIADVMMRRNLKKPPADHLADKDRKK